MVNYKDPSHRWIFDEVRADWLFPPIMGERRDWPFDVCILNVIGIARGTCLEASAVQVSV